MFNKKINNINKKIFIDYAHTPDGLKNVLETIKSNYKKKITLVFWLRGVIEIWVSVNSWVKLQTNMHILYLLPQITQDQKIL